VVRQARSGAGRQAGREVADEAEEEIEEKLKDEIKDKVKEKAGERVRRQESPDEEGEGGDEPEERPDHVPFPIIILPLAILTDILDFLSLTGIGFVVSVIIQIFALLGIAVWLVWKGMSSWGKQQLQGTWMKFALSMLGEFIPVLDVGPWTALFVWTTYSTLRKAELRDRRE
jgi:hypothetical protein